MNATKDQLLLYAITDSSWLKGETLPSQVEKALRGGATMLQYREKHLDDTAFIEEARALQKLCREYHVPFIVNDRVEIALQLDADGVHVGQSDMDAEDVRAKLGPDKILGVTAKTVEQAQRAERMGADYLGVGAMFHTDSKADAEGITMQDLRDICAAVSIPVVAIGGISAENIAQLYGSGACGVSVISAIFAQEDIEAAARDMKRLAQNMMP